MAATVTANLTDVTLGLDSGDWNNTDGTDTEIYKQGTGSESWYVAKNSTPVGTFDAYGNNGNTTYDMSGTNTHLYFWVYSSVALLNGTKANGGLTIQIESDTAQGAATTGTELWNIAGSDTWDGRWTCFIVDVAGTSDTSTGTIDLANIGTVEFGVNASGTSYRSSPANYWIDAIRFGTGLTAYGTDFDYSDVAAIDQLVANQYGIMEEVDGVIFVQGKLIIDDNASTTTFNSTAETLAFRDNVVSSGLHNLSYTGSGSTVVIKGLSVKSSGLLTNTRYDFDASGTVGSFSISGSNFNRGALLDFKTGQSIITTVFDNCFQVDPSTSTFNTNTLTNYIGTEGGALLWPSGTLCTSCNFINCDYGIEITQIVDQTFNGHTFDDVGGKYDVGLSGGTSISIAKTGGANPNSYYDHTVSGDTVTFTASYDHVLTGMAENTEVTYVRQSDGVAVFHVEDVSATGTTTYTHSGGELVDILIFHIDYTPELSNILDLTLPNSDASAGITQFSDDFYLNP